MASLTALPAFSISLAPTLSRPTSSPALSPRPLAPLSPPRPRRVRHPVCVAAAPRRPPLPSPSPAPDLRAGFATDVRTAAEFVAVQAAAAAAERVVYVLFHAGYCRACKAVLPKFRALAAQFPSAAFVTVRLEEGRELAARLGIRSVPSVQIYRGALGKVDEFPCAPVSLPRLRDTVRELSGVSDADEAGEQAGDEVASVRA